MLNSILKGKSIILGVSGSISAYKAPLLVRELVKSGTDVNVVLTNSAQKFVTKDTLSNLSRNKVITEMFDSDFTNEGAWHISLAHKADLMVIAPSSATTLSKLANGNCDNALIALAIALPQNIPVLIFPAMDFTMYESKQVQRNIQILRDFGYKVIEPEYGELSSGLVGKGRLPEIENIVKEIQNVFSNNSTSSEKTKDNYLDEEVKKHLDEKANIKLKAEIELETLKKANNPKPLAGKNVLITAGPTQEKIDDVRFISNFSTGKMGYELVDEAINLGANVFLVSGPVNLEANPTAKLSKVKTALEMNDATLNIFENNHIDISIITAAVADYRPVSQFDGKIKKNVDDFDIKLIKNPDILANIGKLKKDNQIIVGFALESQNALENAKAKLSAKNCDIIVLNYANQENSGFGGDLNTAQIITKSGQEIATGTISKKELAKKILEEIIKLH